jgi:geranylgeranyl reductase family protein
MIGCAEADKDPGMRAIPGFDAIVVGGGPAGAAAAAELARGGARVALFEREALPRYKTCGGGIVGRARRWLPPAALAVIERECRVAVLHEHGCAASWRVERDSPILATAMRAELDAALLDVASKAGANVYAPCAVRAVEPAAREVIVRTSRGDFRARCVVGADGARSPIAAQCGWNDAPQCIPAIEYEIEVSDRVFERFAGAARFDFGIVPGGYAWIFPKRAHLSIGVLTTRAGVRGLPRYLADYMRVAGIDSIRQVEKHGALIPAAPRAGGPARGRVRLAGDAAGLVDPLTYEGISAALASGTHAARALLAEDFHPRAARVYVRSLERELLPELLAAQRLARILYGAPRLRRFAFLRAGQALSEAMCEVVGGSSNAHELVRRPRSWGRLAVAMIRR